MNDNLKELAGIANFGHMEDGEVVYDPRLAVFAELIVAKCCDSMLLMESKYPANLTVIEIKKYFGVE